MLGEDEPRTGMVGTENLVPTMYLVSVTTHYLVPFGAGALNESLRLEPVVGTVRLGVYVSAYSIGSLVLGKTPMRMEHAV